jgi:hypothetical protein
MGSPPFATENLKNPSIVSARTRTGSLADPWLSAFPTRFETNWPIRDLSQLTGALIA